jgi:SPX domain protein involved in polyphosphate accumulation
MKYGDYWRRNRVPEWQDYYINFIRLKGLVSVFKKVRLGLIEV